jgi:hypothetical protein
MSLNFYQALWNYNGLFIKILINLSKFVFLNKIKIIEKSRRTIIFKSAKSHLHFLATYIFIVYRTLRSASWGQLLGHRADQCLVCSFWSFVCKNKIKLRNDYHLHWSLLFKLSNLSLLAGWTIIKVKIQQGESFVALPILHVLQVYLLRLLRFEVYLSYSSSNVLKLLIFLVDTGILNHLYSVFYQLVLYYIII